MDGSSRNGPGGVNGSDRGGMSRAERFEDEKRRIIDSCFGKKDQDGSCKISPFCAEGISYMLTPRPSSIGIIHHTY